MAKHTTLAPAKRPKKRATKREQPKAAPSPSSPASRLAMLAGELASVQTMSEAIARTLEAGDATPALARERASLVRSMSGLSAEMRQLEKHEAKLDKDISPGEFDALVLEYLTEIPRERREDLLRRLTERVGDRSLLSH